MPNPEREMPCIYIEFTPAVGGDISKIAVAVVHFLSTCPPGMGAKFTHNGRMVLVSKSDTSEDVWRQWNGWRRDPAPVAPVLGRPNPPATGPARGP